MKRNYLLLSFLLIGILAGAQKPAGTPKTNATKKNVTPKVYNVVEPGSYESNLVQGKLVLDKTFVKDPAGNSYKVTYTLFSQGEIFAAKEKILDIKLSKEFFEGVFLKSTADISAKSASLSKFVQENNISLNDEKGWIEVVKYFNGL